MEDVKKTKWLKNSRGIIDEFGNKILEATEITEIYDGVVREDILNGMNYSDVNQLQQMLYHAFKRIEELESRIQELESKSLESTK